MKSKGLSDESIKLVLTSNNSLAPGLSYVGNKIMVKLDGSCLKQDKVTLTYGRTVNIYIVYEIDLRDRGYDDYSAPENFLFSLDKLVKNADIDKYKYFGYSIGFDRCGTFSVANGFGKNVINFGVDVSSSVHVDNKKKYILILGEGSTEGLHDRTLAAEKRYSINFTESRKIFA